MLEEAIAVIRKLHEGKEISHHGTHYEVQEARIYTLPTEPVPIYVSGFGPQATKLAGRIGDGYSTAMPDAELVKTFRKSGGGDKAVQAGTKVTWDRDADAALDLVHRLWGTNNFLADWFRRCRARGTSAPPHVWCQVRRSPRA
jgi:G6PDH family F420-dependent oxidoreductase